MINFKKKIPIRFSDFSDNEFTNHEIIDFQVPELLPACHMIVLWMTQVTFKI